MDVDGRIELWDLSKGKPVMDVFTLKGQYARPSVAVAPDGSRVAIGDDFAHLMLLDASSHSVIRTFTAPVVDQRIAKLNPEHPASIDGIAFSPNGKWIAFGGGNSPLMVRDTLSGALLLNSVAACTDYSSFIDCLSFGIAFTSDGKWLVQATDRDKLNLWKTSSWQRGKDISIPGLRHFVLTPDGRKLFNATSDNWITVWDLQSGRQIGFLKDPDPDQPYESWWVKSLDLDPTGRWLVSRHGDNAIRIWDVDSGTHASHSLATDGNGATISPYGHFLLVRCDSVLLEPSDSDSNHPTLHPNQSTLQVWERTD